MEISERRVSILWDTVYSLDSKAEGREEGREEGMRALVNTCKAFNIAMEMVEEKLQEQFGISKELAGEKIQQYW